jgi:very-short-patch-repair endonuclease
LPDRTLDAARTLRGAQTGPEALLWFYLRARRLGGHKFRRQHAIPPYVVDFVCEAEHLIVEIDGGQHAEDAGKYQDEVRSAALERLGYRVARFWDFEVLQELEAVLTEILRLVGDQAAVQVRTLTPAPLPMGEGKERSVES